MRVSGAVLALALVPLGGCSVVGLEQIRGSGVVKTESRTASGFTKVVGAGSNPIEIVVGKPFSVSVTGDDNIVPLIETTVRDSTLYVGGKGNYSTKKGLKVSISMPTLASLRLLGSGVITARGVSGKSLDVILDGSGQIRAEGSVGQLRAELNGSGDVELTKLAANAANLELAGSGRIGARVKTSLHAEISGSGEIVYSGSPTTQKSVTGSGQIRQARSGGR